MKLLLVIDNLNSGGAQRQIVNLGVGLKEYGHDVEFLVYHPGDHFEHLLKKNEISIHTFFKRSKYDMASLIGAIRWMKKGNYDAIGAFLFVPSFYALLFQMVYRSRTRILVSERMFSSPLWEGRMQKLIRKMYGFADVVTANSISQTQFLKANFPRFADKIVYIPNGLKIDDLKVKEAPTVKEALRIVSVGTINAKKNTKLLIEALRRLRQDHGIDAQVRWLGRAEEFLGKENLYFEECKQLLGEHDLEDAWRWEGKVKDVPHFLLQADVMAHPSIGEGFPNAVCEAMACGLPVIASRIIDHPYIIDEGSNGFLFENDNVDDLVSGLLSFNDLGLEERAQMQREARKTAEQKFRLSKMVAAYNEQFTA